VERKPKRRSCARRLRLESRQQCGESPSWRQSPRLDVAKRQWRVVRISRTRLFRKGAKFAKLDLNHSRKTKTAAVPPREQRPFGLARVPIGLARMAQMLGAQPPQPQPAAAPQPMSHPQ